VLVAFKIKTPDDDLRIKTYVAVYIYESYNKGGFNSASVGVNIVSFLRKFVHIDVTSPWN
jgi:hypothetical protein